MKKFTWKKGLMIFSLIFLSMLVLLFLLGLFNTKNAGSFREQINVIHVTGTIVDGTEGNYSQEWLLDQIEEAKNNPKNRGIILFLDTPGGSVYATANAYHKLMEYKEETKRPIFAYMGPVAASGGYYMAMAADKVYANPSTWTGSIGVRIGDNISVKGLMDKLGIKVTTITSGENKAMGSPFQDITPEQIEIYKSIINETYDTFVNVVAKGRNLSVDYVRPLADGRIYTAKQALDNKLIDDISYYDEFVNQITQLLSNPGLNFVDYKYQGNFSLLDMVSTKFSSSNRIGNMYDKITDYSQDHQGLSISYLAPIGKN